LPRRFEIESGASTSAYKQEKGRALRPALAMKVFRYSSKKHAMESGVTFVTPATYEVMKFHHLSQLSQMGNLPPVRWGKFMQVSKT